MKKLLLTASGIFLAASLYIGVNSYKNINSGSDLLLANVEALAYIEGGCSSCGDCSGNYWICSSEYGQFWSDYYNNCSGGNPNVYTYGGC